MNAGVARTAAGKFSVHVTRRSVVGLGDGAGAARKTLEPESELHAVSLDESDEHSDMLRGCWRMNEYAVEDAAIRPFVGSAS